MEKTVAKDDANLPLIVQPEFQNNSQPNTVPKTPRRKSWLFIEITVLVILLLGITGFSVYKSYREKKFEVKTTNSSSREIPSKNTQTGLVYTDPCKSGDKKGCIMKNAYSKLKKSSESGNYTVVWNEAFKTCEENPNDESILFSKEQCKLDVCENLHLGDGNIKYNYPESEECKSEVLPVCGDGSIIDNIPCSCDVPAGPNAAYTQEWLENYWNKYRKNDSPIYCCSGKQQDSSCSSQP